VQNTLKTRLGRSDGKKKSVGLQVFWASFLRVCLLKITFVTASYHSGKAMPGEKLHIWLGIAPKLLSFGQN
jgi:hypothetical protein